MLAGVLSAPWAPGDPRSPAWWAACITFLKNTFGDNLLAAVGHVDEGHDHVHFYVAAPGFARVNDLHPGKAAMESAKADGATAKEQKAAYVGAMRALQDAYHEQVARHHGQTRIGPRRERLTRPEWRARRDQAALLAERLRQDETKAAEHAKRRADLEAEEARQAAARHRLTSEHEQRALRLDAKAAQIATKEAELAAREARVAAKETLLAGLFEKFKKTVAAIFGRLTSLEKAELRPVMAEAKEVEYALHPERAPRKDGGLEPHRPDAGPVNGTPAARADKGT